MNIDPAADQRGPASRRVQVDPTSSLLHQSTALIAEANFPAAINLLAQALTVTENAGQRGTPSHLLILKTLGDLCYAVGSYGEAEKHLLGYLEISPNSAESASVRLTLAKVYSAAERSDQALSVLGQAIHIGEMATGQDYDPSLLAEAHWLSAMVYRALNKPGDASTSCRKALRIYSEVYGPAHPRTLFCEASLYTLSIKRGDLAEAATRLPQILAILRQRPPEDESDLMTALSASAHLACHQANALRAIRRDLRERQNPTPKSGVQDLLRSFGLDNDSRQWLAEFNNWIPSQGFKDFLKSLEKELLRRAKGHLREKLELAERCHGKDHPCLAEVFDQLSAVSDWLGQRRAQNRYEQEATRIREFNCRNMEL